MKINVISTNYLNTTNKSLNFKAKREEENVIKKDVDNSVECFTNNRKTSLAIVFGVILGVLACHDIISAYKQNKPYESQNSSLTNDTFVVSKEMEDTYQLVLSNKLNKAKINLSALGYKNLQNAINLLEMPSKK